MQRFEYFCSFFLDAGYHSWTVVLIESKIWNSWSEITTVGTLWNSSCWRGVGSFLFTFWWVVWSAHWNFCKDLPPWKFVKVYSPSWGCGQRGITETNKDNLEVWCWFWCGLCCAAGTVHKRQCSLFGCYFCLWIFKCACFSVAEK